ncbi:MAG: gluconokinase [Gemmatimonadaceae bacterium]|nr:gluconokinase [Gemmatimonadaceae bacterium]
MRGRYVVMGVSGAGKSVIGSAFAESLGVDFVEGDRFHPARNIERMSAGIPLTDDDRAGWLGALAARLARSNSMGTGLVMTCSALKRAYRDVLRAGTPDLRIVYLRGPQHLLAERLAGRAGHFMPQSLLESQLDTLEPPADDEDAWVYDIARSPEAIVSDLVARTRA